MEPSPLQVSQNVKPLPMTSVLLTGATGYLGSHVLHELLATTNAHIYCLIRPSAQTTIEAKLIESMQFYFGNTIAQQLKDRVTVIQGDLGKQRLHLSDEDEQIILKEINAIIHCGADVRHFGAADHFNNVNVNGTRYLLEIAKQKPVYISIMYRQLVFQRS